MRIECLTCQKYYTLPDDRLPQGKAVSFPCPACKGKITLDLRIQEEKPQASADPLFFKPLSEESESELSSDDLKRRIIKHINDLPAMPKVLFKARQVLSDPNSSFVEVLRYHHPEEANGSALAHIVNLAAHIAKQSGFGSVPGFDNQPVHTESIEKMRLKPENIEEITGQVTASVEEITANLD